LSLPVHDLQLVRQEVESTSVIGQVTTVNATIRNSGLSDEAGIDVQLHVNGSVFDQATISLINSGEQVEVNFEWTPELVSIYNVTTYVVPVTPEADTRNNNFTSWILISEQFDLSNFPAPFVNVSEGKAECILTPGACDPRGPCSPSHTIDVAAGNYLAYSLGTISPNGGLEVYMDWEITYFNSTHVTEIYRPGNVVAFGSPSVNTISWYYHYYKTTPSGESVLPAYIGRDGPGLSGQYIYSKASQSYYRMDNDYGQGIPVTDYAMISLYHDHPDNRWALIVAGLSGYSTREAARWLSGFPTMDCEAVILRLIDDQGDGEIESVEVVETVHIY
jgi:hypothetical protein